MVAIIISITISTIISIIWVKSIHKMKEEHPDYKGDDFLQP
jgi:Na+/citrate or Na+/malate symporter